VAVRSLRLSVTTTQHIFYLAGLASLQSISMGDISMDPSSDLGNVISALDPTLPSHDHLPNHFNSFGQQTLDFPVSRRTAAPYEQPHVSKSNPIGDSLVYLLRADQRLTMILLSNKIHPLLDLINQMRISKSFSGIHNLN